ncbi:MAG TPA: hypothetical protein VN667_14575, partial [Burkholderiales bacterium]|nr:hypothetical protein [Burkholderiales bacterium]
MTMTKDTRRWYGGQIAAARRESNRADARMFKLLDQYTARACPLARGDIVVITKLGQRHFYMVFRVDSDQKDSQPVPHWSAVARRCTK